MFTKDLRSISLQEQRARRWAVQYGHPPPPVGKTFAEHYGAAVDRVDGATLVDRVALARAKAAGERAQREGYGSRRCGTCPGCTYAGTCRRPPSLAMARLRAGQAADADRTRDQVVLAELEGLTVELAALLG